MRGKKSSVIELNSSPIIKIYLPFKIDSSSLTNIIVAKIFIRSPLVRSLECFKVEKLNKLSTVHLPIFSNYGRVLFASDPRRRVFKCLCQKHFWSVAGLFLAFLRRITRAAGNSSDVTVTVVRLPDSIFFTLVGRP